MKKQTTLRILCRIMAAVMLIAALASPFAKLITAGAVILMLALFLLLARRWSVPFRLVTVSAVVLLVPLLIGYFTYDRYFARADSYGNEVVSVRATVTDLRYQTDYSVTLYAEAEEIDGKPADGKLSVYLQTSTPIAVGDILN